MPDQPDPFEILGLEPDGHPPAHSSPGPRSPAPSSTAVDEGYDDGAGYDDPSVEAGDWDDDGGEYVHLSAGAGRGGGRRWGLVLLGFLVVIVLLVGVAAVWVKGQVDPGSPGEEVSFVVPTGSTTSDIATMLADKRIITNATVFEWYLKVKREDPQFQAGEYEGMRVNSSMGDVVDILKAGPAPPRDVTFLVREGLWESETRQLILDTFPGIDPAALDAALTGTHPALQPQGSTDLEGFLFPATYEVPEAQTSDAQALVNQMVAAFDAVSSQTGLPDATAKLQGVAGSRQITPYQALIVASLVEAEAKVPEDRPKIARVIYNRLKEGMTLGIDATVLYAIGERTDSLTQSQLATDSPYNTRVKAGLPPTPINSPGRASIDAALNPAEGDWLYYVLTDTDGRHYFTDSYSDFQRAVNDAQDRGVF
ncbi:MAG TPA: endolytic transglycosylase MltG [Acidimicrobiales bacterium]